MRCSSPPSEVQESAPLLVPGSCAVAASWVSMRDPSAVGETRDTIDMVMRYLSAVGPVLLDAQPTYLESRTAPISYILVNRRLPIFLVAGSIILISIPRSWYAA